MRNAASLRADTRLRIGAARNKTPPSFPLQPSRQSSKALCDLASRERLRIPPIPRSLFFFLIPKSDRVAAGGERLPSPPPPKNMLSRKLYLSPAASVQQNCKRVGPLSCWCIKGQSGSSFFFFVFFLKALVFQLQLLKIKSKRVRDGRTWQPTSISKETQEKVNFFLHNLGRHPEADPGARAPTREVHPTYFRDSSQGAQMDDPITPRQGLE